MIQPEALVQLLIALLLFFVPLYFVVKAAVAAGIRQALPEAMRRSGRPL